MVKLITRESALALLKRLIEKLEESNKQILIGEVKAIRFEKKVIKRDDKEIELEKYHAGQVVFTKHGIGTVVIPTWRSSIRSNDGRVSIMLRKNRKRIKLYEEKDIFKLVVTNENGKNVPISPMFYDYLITSIDKVIKYRINNRNYAMLLEKEQQRLKKDYLASLSGVYHVVTKLHEENLW